MSIAISEISLFNALKSKLGEKEAEDLVAFVKESVRENIKPELENLVSKKDLAETKVDIIKWMVSLIFGLALMIIGLYIKK
jgi:hypothetical protein